jgi:hypothetical protein
LNLHSTFAGGLQPLRLANAQPTHVSEARVGIEPTDDHQGLSLVALPSLRTVPSSVPDGIRTHDLHRDRVASTPGCSTRTKVAQVGFEPTASLGLSKGGLPVAYRAIASSVPGAGVEPTSAGSEPDVLPVRRPRNNTTIFRGQEFAKKSCLSLATTLSFSAESFSKLAERTCAIIERAGKAGYRSSDTCPSVL